MGSAGTASRIDGSIASLFEAQAARRPNQTALTCERVNLSFAELNSRANRLSRRLLQLGLRDEALVGLYLNRTPDLLVGMLGILKAGLAYLPLDPSYPGSRLAFMLSDGDVSALVTQRSLASRFAFSDRPVIRLDQDWPAIASLSDEDGAADIDGRQVAYVIYTSGSSGRPKGTLVTHEGVTSMLLSMQDRLGIRPGDAMLAMTAISFDIALLELMLPLAAGGRVVLAPRPIQLWLPQLVQLLSGSKVRFAQATPTTWRLLFEAGWQGNPQLIAVSGGEALGSELASRLLSSCAEVWNVYGPTETTVWSMAGRIRDPDQICLGEPLAGTEILILDESLRPIVRGSTGELYIAGVGVARAYLNRPDLTAERFLPCPWSTKPGTRMYRTGDQVRVLSNGRIQFGGRVDTQVKIRGNRVEPGEIEAAILAHPAVAMAAVSGREWDDGQTVLVAYVKFKSGYSVSASELRSALFSMLPPAMVPSIFLQVEAMPLTPNLKIDRRQLPHPLQVRAPTDRDANYSWL